MQIRRITIGSFILLLVCGSLAQAGILEPDAITRYVSASQSSNYLPSGSDREDGVGVSSFSATAMVGSAIAQQTSSITSTQILVSGSSTAAGDIEDDLWCYGSASSYFSEQFTITSTMSYSVSFDWNVGSGFESLLGVSLTGPSGTVFEDGHVDGGFGTFSTQGTLAPGQYELTVSGSSHADMWGPYTVRPSTSFSMEFTLTPEPATAVLFGMAGLVMARRRRGR